MRAQLVICLLVVVVIAVAIGMLTNVGTRLGVTADVPPATLASSDVMPVAEASPNNVLGPGLVATRTFVVPSSSEGLADGPSACLRVVDFQSKRPIAGAAIRRVQGGSEIAFTDERGLANVPLKGPEQLAVVVDDYLLRLVPTTLGSTEAQPQQVTLVRDELSLRRSFEFVGPGGDHVAEAFVRFRPNGADANGVMPPPKGDVVVQRAWTEHAMLAGLPVCADVPVQLGVYSEDRVHRMADGAEVRFLWAGDFSVEVATTSGLIARTDLRIDGGPADHGQVVHVVLTRGDFVGGTVRSLATSSPLPDAEITLPGGDPLGLLAKTGEDGGFRIGPLLPGRVTLNVRHGDHQPLAFGPVQPPVSDLRIFLQPLPQTTLRGRVRSRPLLQPIADATILWSPSAGAPVRARSAADGTFLLLATGTSPSRLAVQAPGYQTYAELVAPGAPFANYDLWPANTLVRLEQHLTAVLQGIVVDAEGRPVAGANVRWTPEQHPSPAGLPGRSVLDGASLELPLVTTTAADGAFSLETHCCGRGRLALAEAGAESAGGLTVDLAPGQTARGLRLQR